MRKREKEKEGERMRETCLVHTRSSKKLLRKHVLDEHSICSMVFTNAALYFPCSMEFLAVSDQRQQDAITAARGHRVAMAY